ncbi:MAG: cellulase family glycosylhydrolase [Spirochaetales bacterium]|nr:cellulase family glycosylhydrolase [Spirochaetales bacterium]
MKLRIKSYILIPLLILLTVSNCRDSTTAADDKASGFSFLKTSGTRIVNEEGQQVLLKGVNLGNWFLIEMWMLGLGQCGIKDQYTLEQILTKRFGKAQKERLLDLYREHYITDRDLKIIKEFGMNVVRLPFWHTLLEDDEDPQQIKEDGWYWLDKAIDMAESNGLYIILDLHGAAGSQNEWDHSGRADYNRLWTEKRYQERTVWLWTQIARRYSKRKSVCGYDLLNEPWGGTKEELRDLTLRCYKAVRRVDADHIMFFSGYFNDISFYGDTRQQGWKNIAFTCHFYPGFFGNGEPAMDTHNSFIRNTIPEYGARLKKYNVPMLIGEFNVVLKSAGGGKMMRRYFEAYNELGWAAIMWSYKAFTAQGGIGHGIWGMVTNAEPLARIDFDTMSEDDIEDWCTGLSTMEYIMDEDLRDWLLR